MGGGSYTEDSFNQNSSNATEFHHSISNSQEEVGSKMDGSSCTGDSIIQNSLDPTESEQSIIAEKMDGSSCREDSIIQYSSDLTEAEQSIRKISVNFKFGVIQASPHQGLEQTCRFDSSNPYSPALNSTSQTTFTVGPNDAIWINISRQQFLGSRAAERANRCTSPQIQHLILLYAQKAVSAERQLAQYIDDCDSLRRRLHVAEKKLLEYQSEDNGPYDMNVPKITHVRACASKVELDVDQGAESIVSLLSRILFLSAAEVAPAEHAEVQTCGEQILLCMKKMAEYPLVQKELFASLHNWSRENMQIDILALMETLQKACRDVTESLNNEDEGPRGMQNPTTIIETLVQMCERMRSLSAPLGHIPYEEKRSGVLKSSWRPGPIPSQCVSSVRCSSGASRRFRTTAGAQPKDEQSLLDKYALKATSAAIKLAESVDECNSLQKEMAKSSEEHDLLRREMANLRRELDECGSQRRAAPESADECISLRRELENLRREAAQSVDECASLRTEVGNLRRSLQAVAVEEPTLALLQFSTSNVETAIRQCVDEMTALIPLRWRRHRLVSGKSPRLESIRWQHVLCEFMFKDFENPSFTVEDTGLFKELVTKKKGRFRYYMSVKDMDPHDLYSQDRSFFEFVHHKWEILRDFFNHRPGFFLSTMLNDILSSFLKLGHRIWCLHKLAFAFEPLDAKIIQVEKDSLFTGDHMLEPEDICPQESRLASAPRTVFYVTLPGFMLGHSIIKAKVCCLESLFS